LISYDEMLVLASGNSDHQQRVIELEPPLVDALTNTEPLQVLEIGNGSGGSGLLILYHIWKIGKGHAFTTVDRNDCPKLILEWAEKFKVPHSHFKLDQQQFIEKLETAYSFIYLDADHRETEVKQDALVLGRQLVRGGVLVIDDVNEWKTLPDLSGVGLTPVSYDVDQGKTRGEHGQHVVWWKRA